MTEPFFELLSQRQDQLTASRHSRAVKSYQEGMAKLAQAQQGGFGDKQLLIEVAENLNLAIRLNRQDPASYIGMAYFLMLLDDLPKARSYVKEALRIDPENEYAKRMLAGIVELKSRQLAETLPEPAPPPPPDKATVSDSEVLTYAGARSLILREVRQILEKVPVPTPSAHPAFVAKLQTQKLDLEEKAEELSQRIRSLSRQHDTTELEHLLRPLHGMIARFEKIAAAAFEFQSLAGDICLTFKRAGELFQSLERGPDKQGFAGRLDWLLDTCDALADRLDALENQKFEIHRLESEYGKLISYVNYLRERWDQFNDGF